MARRERRALPSYHCHLGARIFLDPLPFRVNRVRVVTDENEINVPPDRSRLIDRNGYTRLELYTATGSYTKRGLLRATTPTIETGMRYTNGID